MTTEATTPTYEATTTQSFEAETPPGSAATSCGAHIALPIEALRGMRLRIVDALAGQV